MLIDDTQFPLVWIHYTKPAGAPGKAGFAGLEEVLARREVFVLLNDEGLAEGYNDHPHDALKEASLWMKRHKADLRAFIAATICIEPDGARRGAAKDFCAAYQAFWGYPMRVVPCEDEARRLAAETLAGAPVRPLWPSYREP